MKNRIIRTTRSAIRAGGGPLRWLVLAVLVAAVAAVAGCDQAPLYSALDEQQANEVEAALLAAGVDARKGASEERGYWAVHVPRESVPQAMEVLRGHGLPRSPGPSMGEVFQKEGFVSSPLEERVRYQHALSQELSRTLMQIDGVVSARVHVALSERTPLEDSSRSASASVVIIQEPDVDLSRSEIDIKAVVTDGVAGLDDVNRVTVKFFNRTVRATPAMAGAAMVSVGQPWSDPMVWMSVALVTLGGTGGAGVWFLVRRKKPGVALRKSDQG